MLVVQATGWGKSAVYWAQPRRCGERGRPTLVVATAALMRTRSRPRSGRLRAGTVNSTNLDEWDAVLGDVRGGRLDVLRSPRSELANPGFARSCPTCCRTGLLVIDEAHCVSDMGLRLRRTIQRRPDAARPGPRHAGAGHHGTRPTSG